MLWVMMQYGNGNDTTMLCDADLLIQRSSLLFRLELPRNPANPSRPPADAYNLPL